MDNTIDSVDGRAVGDNPQELTDQSSSSHGHTYNPPQQHLYLYPPALFLVNPLAPFPVNPPAPFPVNPPVPFPVNPPAPPYDCSHSSFPVVKLGDLPLRAREPEVANFLRGLRIIDILMVFEHGSFTGNAFCVLANPAGVELSIRRNGQKMGSKIVAVQKSTRHNYHLAVEKRVVYLERKASTNHTGVMRLLGLPNSVDRKEVVDFFKDFIVAESSVHITVNSEGQQIGEAFVEFNNAGASRAAMDNDRKLLRDHYVCLVPSSYDELERAVPGWR